MPRPRLRPFAALPAFLPRLCLAIFAAAAGPAPAPAPPVHSPAPHASPEPRVFRGFLEGEASPMIFLALDERMSLAYDERGGSLFLAWNGKAVPASGPGPAEGGPRVPPEAGGGKEAPPSTAAYRASGAVYHRRVRARPWEARGPGGTLPVTVRFEGISARGDLAALEWSLQLPDGRSIRVSEVPMYDDHYGDDGLFRNFEVNGIPAGHSVRLDLGGRGMPETWGGGADGGIAVEAGRRLLVQEADGQTPLKVTWSDPRAPGEAAPEASW